MKRKQWRILFLLMLCCLTLVLLTVTASATDIVDSGSCGADGDNVTWTLDSDGVLTISGSGKMADYSSFNGKKSQVKTVVIEDGVTSIGKRTFYDCSALTKITIPDSVTAIGYSAFSSCSALTEITIPDSVTSIGDSAFSSCSALTEITIPDSVTSIGDSAFSSCSALTEITIPGSVTSIGESAFCSCSKLTDVYLTDMDAWCRISFGNEFSNPMCYAENVYLNNGKFIAVNVPGDVTSLKYTFYRFHDLTTVTLPDGLTDIGDYTFWGCTSLKKVNIPQTVTNIGYSAFFGCGELREIALPDGLTSIEPQAFLGCTSLTSFEIPDKIRAIEYAAFDDCYELTDVKLPASLTSIGAGSFSYCRKLKGIYITDLSAWCKINFGNAYANPLWNGGTLYLNGVKLTALEIPSDVSAISSYAFRNDTSIEQVAIPKTLVEIGSDAFSGCTGIKQVFYEGSEEEWNEITISTGNEPLTGAQILYNTTLTDYYCRITVSASDGGTLGVSSNAVKAGETITVTATPNEGYQLEAIYVDGAAIERNTFTATGNHTVSARFTLISGTGGTSAYKLESITVENADGEKLQALSQEKLLVTISITKLQEADSATVMLAQYDSDGRYQGLVWVSVKTMPVGSTVSVTLPVDNRSGSIASLKAFVVSSLTDPTPIGNAVSFGTM